MNKNLRMSVRVCTRIHINLLYKIIELSDFLVTIQSELSLPRFLFSLYSSIL